MLLARVAADRVIGQPDSRARNHNRPQQVCALIDQKIVEIAVGSEHTLALSNEGEVWAWGNNGDGQLGLGHTNIVREPQLVTTTGIEKNAIKQVLYIVIKPKKHNFNFQSTVIFYFISNLVVSKMQYLLTKLTTFVCH